MYFYHFFHFLQDFLDLCIHVLTLSVQDPAKLGNKNELGELVNLLDEMKQLHTVLSMK